MPKEGISLIGHDDILSYEELLSIACIAVKKGITKIRITGGEPLARKGVVQFVSALSGIQGIQDLSMTTNGILLSPAAQPLRSAGLKRLNISLDSLNPDKYTMITRGGDINQIIAGIKSAQEAGFSPIKINVVVIRGINDDEINSFAKLSMEKNLQVRFIEYMPVGMENGWEKERFVSSDEIRQRIKTIGPLLELPSDNGSGPAQMYTIEGAQGRIGFISALSDHFCATCNRLRLTPDGKLRTCLFSDAEVDLKTNIRQGCSDDALADIINEAILSKPRKHHATEQVFKKCIRGMSAIGG
jgi:cyclic pyranopterin phosphate synthase